MQKISPAGLGSLERKKHLDGVVPILSGGNTFRSFLTLAKGAPHQYVPRSPEAPPPPLSFLTHLWSLPRFEQKQKEEEAGGDSPRFFDLPGTTPSPTPLGAHHLFLPTQKVPLIFNYYFPVKKK